MELDAVIKQFGGQSALAQQLGIRQSAIAYWVKKGSIPAKWHQKIATLAQQNNLIIDFEKSTALNQNPEIFDAQTKSVSTSTEELPTRQFLFYVSEQTGVRIQVAVGNETIWASQKGMAEIYSKAMN